MRVPPPLISPDLPSSQLAEENRELIAIQEGALDSRLTALHEEREYALEGLGSVGASVARLEAQLAKIEAIQSEGGLREGGAVAPGACGGARGACCMTLGGQL